MTDDTPSEQARLSILEAALKLAPFDGWTDKTLRSAVLDAELPEGSEALFFPGGPIELITFWGERLNAQTEAALAARGLSNMKVREKVTEGVLAGLMAIGPHEQAMRRALSKLALPSAKGAGAPMLWAAADTIWRAIGDTSTDSNYYSKRTVLSAVIGSSLTAWLNDITDDKTDARAFLDRRIDNVMQFEIAKAKFRKTASTLPDPVKFLSDLRYGRRRRRR